MSVWQYQSEAKRHVWEFVDLGYEREADRRDFYAMTLANPARTDAFIAEQQEFVIELVQAAPSRRVAKLRRITGGDAPSQFALILGGWQLCRKAVLAYGWLMDNESRFTPGQAYRAATVSQGLLFDQLKERRWTRWPFQWGPSPFPGEKSYREPYEAPDFDEVMDNYNPETGLY